MTDDEKLNPEPGPTFEGANLSNIPNISGPGDPNPIEFNLHVAEPGEGFVVSTDQIVFRDSGTPLSENLRYAPCWCFIERVGEALRVTACAEHRKEIVKLLGLEGTVYDGEAKK